MSKQTQVRIIVAEIGGVECTKPSVRIAFEKPLEATGEYLVIAKRHVLAPNEKPYMFFGVFCPLGQIAEDENELIATLKKVARRVAIKGALEVLAAAGDDWRSQLKQRGGHGR